MKYTVAATLVFLWLAAIVNFPTMPGIFHLLPAVAAGLVVVRVIQGRRAVI